MVEKRRRLKEDAIALVAMMDLKEKEMGIRVFKRLGFLVLHYVRNLINLDAKGGPGLPIPMGQYFSKREERRWLTD